VTTPTRVLVAHTPPASTLEKKILATPPPPVPMADVDDGQASVHSTDNLDPVVLSFETAEQRQEFMRHGHDLMRELRTPDLASTIFWVVAKAHAALDGELVH